MGHKAFVFDFDQFARVLAVPIYNALRQNDTADLIGFITANFAKVKDPYEGGPLPDGWQSACEINDVQNMADIALTKFYDPSENFGLGTEWIATEAALRSLGLDATAILLGGTVGPADSLFDPGLMGSYFQSPQDVLANLSVVRNTALPTAEVAPVAAAVEMLERASKVSRGLYITF